MIHATLVDDAKSNLTLVTGVVTVASLLAAVGGMRLLDPGHRQTSKGVLAMALSLLVLSFAVGELVVMANVFWSSISNDGSFEPVLLFHDIWFAGIVVLAVALVWTFVRAARYTRDASR